MHCTALKYRLLIRKLAIVMLALASIVSTKALSADAPPSQATLSIAFISETPAGDPRAVSIAKGITEAVLPYGKQIQITRIQSQFDANGAAVAPERWVDAAMSSIHSADVVLTGWGNDYDWGRSRYPHKPLINLSVRPVSESPNEIAIGQDISLRIARTVELVKTLRTPSSRVWIVHGDSQPDSPSVKQLLEELAQDGYATVEMVNTPPDISDLVKLVGAIPPQDTIFYFPITAYQSSKGLGAGAVIERLNEATAAPIFPFWYNLVKRGGVGGYVFVPSAAGSRAIEAAIDYAAFGSFKENYSTSEYLINELEFLRSGGSFDLIPAEAERFNPIQPGLSDYYVSLLTTGSVIIVIVFGLGALFIVRERRQRIRLEAISHKLENNRDRLELVLKGTRLGLWDWNPQTNEVVFDVRWCEMLGYSLDEIEFSVESWSSRVHPDDIEGCFADITAHLEGKTDFYDNTHRMKHKDGRWIYIRDRGRVVSRDSRGVTRFTGTHEDVTDEVETKQALQHSLTQLTDVQRKQNEMYGMIAHELRTPISTVSMLAASSDTEFLDHKQDVVEAASHLLNTVDDMRMLINPDMSRPVRSELFTVRDINASITSAVASIVASTGIRFDQSLSLNPEDVTKNFLTDTYRLRVAVTNLIKNACLHSRGSQVKMDTALANCVDGAYITWSISDNGIGIPADLIEHLFDQHTRGETSAEGSGLGLYITRTWIEEIGGSVVYESLENGSLFKVSIPLLTDEDLVESEITEAKPMTSLDESALNRILQELNILFVEDENMLRLMSHKLLTKLGASVDEAEDGVAGLSKFNADHNLVMTDYFMPNMNGIEMIEHLRKQGVSIPIIGVTAATIGSQKQDMLEAGADVVLSKPLTAEAFKEAVSELLSRGRLSL